MESKRSKYVLIALTVICVLLIGLTSVSYTHLLEEIGAPEGTTFIARNLFYNTPARRKFLKTPMTEGSHVAELVEKIALSHPEISIRFIQNNQNKLHTSGNHNLKDIIYTVFGREIAANLLAVEAKKQDIFISGFIGKPVIARGNRNYENYFINGRYIRSSIISKAIEEAYKPFMTVSYTHLDDRSLRLYDAGGNRGGKDKEELSLCRHHIRDS